MRKFFILLFLLVFSTGSCFSQYYRYKHAKGLLGGNSSLGRTKNGYEIEFGAIEYRTAEKQHLGHINYQWGEIGTTDYSLISANYLRQFTVYDLRQKLYLNIFTGGSMGYENIKNNLLNRKKNTVVPGAVIGAEIETNLTDRMAAIANIREDYLFNSNIGKWSCRIKVGVRYFF